MINLGNQLYFLGDAIDRGNNNIKCMIELLSHPRITYLKGNHEDMFLNWWNYKDELYNDYAQLWIQNGGNKTFQELNELSKEEQEKLIYNLKKKLVNYVFMDLEDKRVFLCHAGCNPQDIDNIINQYNIYNLIWNRKHIEVEWPIYDQYNNIYIVHGHTPVQHFQFNNQLEVMKYANGHKFNIDMGCFDSGFAAVIDIDTIGTNNINIKYFNEKGVIRHA